MVLTPGRLTFTTVALLIFFYLGRRKYPRCDWLPKLKSVDVEEKETISIKYNRIPPTFLVAAVMALNIPDHSPVASAPMLSLYNISVPSFSVILHEESRSWLYTTVVILLSLLAVEQAVYRYKKRHLPGATWTIPVIGKFADSVNPTIEGYKKQWDSGALSAVSVFNM